MKLSSSSFTTLIGEQLRRFRISSYSQLDGILHQKTCTRLLTRPIAERVDRFNEKVKFKEGEKKKKKADPRVSQNVNPQEVCQVARNCGSRSKLCQLTADACRDKREFHWQKRLQKVA